MKTDISPIGPIFAVIIIGMMVICLIPNRPRIIITESNQPSIQSAKVESERVELMTTHRPTRQSLGFFEVTAYCPCEKCCGEYADGITASGHMIRIGDRFCAADSIIPFGKYLDIPGYGYVPVLDRGGAIKGRKLDVFFNTHQEALEWGRKKLEIYCWVQQDD